MFALVQIWLLGVRTIYATSKDKTSLLTAQTFLLKTVDGSWVKIPALSASLYDLHNKSNGALSATAVYT